VSTTEHPPPDPAAVGPAPDGRAWEERNNAFLRAALDWLRLRVTRLLPATPATLPVPPVAPSPALEPGDDSQSWRRRRRPIAALEVPASAAGDVGEGVDARIAAAEQAVDEAASADPPPALHVLAWRLGLTRFERDVLLLAAAPELDTTFGRLYAEVQGDPTRRQATFALAMAVFDEPEWAALAPHRPLRRLDLAVPGPADGLVAAPLRVPERVVNFLKGLGHLDERLVNLLAPLDVTTPDSAPSDDDPEASGVVEPAPSQRSAVAEIVRAATAGEAVNLVGVDRPSLALVAMAAAAELDRRLVRLPVAHLPHDVDGIAALGRLLERERLLSPILPYLDATESGPEPGDGAVDRLLAALDGPVLLGSRDPWPGLPHRATVVDVARPTPAEQRATWARLVDDPAVAAQTAAEFDLDLGLIHAVAAATRGAADRGRAVRDACRARCRPRLGQLAERLSPRVDTDALVLPPDVEARLLLLEQQVRHRATVLDEWGLAEQSSRGLGITALFAGESGVGKTLAAEVLAARLDLDLYRIDLSGVVSKYIGETEKNLRAVFDAADRGGSILFFDEADALFGKRSEVRDSHDRYANVEVSYLLTRMETHRGVAILATNMKRGMDEAFARRLRITVEFPFPGAQERAKIWERAFPPRAVLRGIDVQRLARLSLAGGAIRNVAVNAAFAGAAATPPGITMRMVLDAARAEYRKLGLPAGPADFAWQEPDPEPDSHAEPAVAGSRP
jgi:ATPase family associated with various cellular activities (AAA)